MDWLRVKATGFTLTVVSVIMENYTVSTKQMIGDKYSFIDMVFVERDWIYYIKNQLR